MNTTVQVPAELPPARVMTALVVLADHLPMPDTIRFQGDGVGKPGTSIMSLSFRTVAVGQAWSRHLGGRTTTYVNPNDNRIYLDEGPIRWHGWSVHLHASEPSTPDQPLDTATRDRLAAVARGDRP